MHIRVILPVIGDALLNHVTEEVQGWVGSGTTVDTASLARGTASIESEYDEALAAPGILDRIVEAKADGVDGVFISCFGDPGVHAAREIIDVPVVGGYEPAMLTAMSLGERIGIVTVLPNVLPMLHSLSRRYGIENRVGTIRVIDLPVLGLEDRETMVERLFEQSVDAIERNEADVLVLGCTGMLGVVQELMAKLAADGHRVPVVDPTGAAITWLESSHRLGVFPSRTTYMVPPAKVRSI
ncbi:aspartate/glutamate racemase family protein [Brevibacterium sp. RIT 803]|uniref:aspartate/glutamate racemase family protein n=1 Tax=Brevibacterium sp. RIT 803 TaxID=2810210 RepID=UPI00195215E1|nr:aspartate/glutamate racemase family protein [Brevibacterium sp. RIT 803]MBM6588860.1 aspartate/glutamate racemase family protein [Brevibacterium sp. RIT 803]